MMFHPFDRDLLMHPTLASLWLTFEFHGHARARRRRRPTPGASALTACLDTFRLVDGQRVHFRDGVRVHGYVTDGGQAVNIIPERAACELSVRAPDGDGARARPRPIVERCARGRGDGERRRGRPSRCARATATWSTTLALARSLRGAPRGPRAQARGTAILASGTGSTDMGDVSHVVPSIHPWLGDRRRGRALFATSIGSPRRPRRTWPAQTAVIAAKALARTADRVPGATRAALEGQRRVAGSRER